MKIIQKLFIYLVLFEIVAEFLYFSLPWFGWSTLLLFFYFSMIAVFAQVVIVVLAVVNFFSRQKIATTITGLVICLFTMAGASALGFIALVFPYAARVSYFLTSNFYHLGILLVLAGLLYYFDKKENSPPTDQVV